MAKKSKLKVFLLIIFLIIVVFGIYLLIEYYKYLQEIKEGQWEPEPFLSFESVENYIIQDTPEGKMVVNENVGLSFMVPEGWNVEKIDYDTVQVLSPDAERDSSGFVKKGCIWGPVVEYYVQRFPDEEHRPQIILKQIQGEKELTDVQELLVVDNYPALKESRKSGESWIIKIEVPVDNIIYRFTSFFPLQEKERCLNDFSEFLETVSINP